MPSYDECCVLLPCSTLEDFPSDASEEDARSLLAAWTVLWHPKLISENEQIPTWYRADGPPDTTTGNRVIVVPRSSVSMLPDGFEQKCRDNDSIKWIDGANRNEMLGKLSDLLPQSFQPLQASHRTASVEDFFALGYAFLQVQVMTRRLRYTSNLDEIYFEKCVVSAANGFIQGDPEATVTSLHDAFDCLAQERDHYFTSDPHLIDLTLLSDSTLEKFFGSLPNSNETAPNGSDAPSPTSDREQEGVLPTPTNVLVDQPIAKSIQNLGSEKVTLLRNLIENQSLGWAGGGPSGDVSLSTETYTGAENQITQAFGETSDIVGIRPPVYARYSGSTPSDMTKVIASLGVAGMISVDFANGTGFSDEAKVVQKGGSVELHTLSAKPIDAASEIPFLAIGAKLGEAIDSGEIAVALMVHWPSLEGDTYRLLRTAASWSLVLGRCWTMEEFFRTGEQPYHHNSSINTAGRADLELTQRVERGEPDPLSRLARQTKQSIDQQNQAMLAAMLEIATGKKLPAGESVEDAERLSQLARAIGLVPSSDKSNMCILNPNACPIRTQIEILGDPHRDKQVYASSGSGKQSIVTVDVSAFGFSVIRNEAIGQSTGRTIGQRIRDVASGTGWFSSTKPIVVNDSLLNAFMEVAIDPESGGIKGVYSGSTRGNRFSLRLVSVGNAANVSKMKVKNKDGEKKPIMKADKIKTVTSRLDIGVIESTGSIVDGDGEKIAKFELTYTLRRGERMLSVAAKLDTRASFGDDPWRNYFALRCAVATDAVIPKLIVRDKIHKANSRRLVAPLGILLDESDRQTLIASSGMAYHRRVEDRFFDTLLCAKGESKQDFTIHYGFEVADPVSTARSVMADPLTMAVEPVDVDASRGWLIHASPKEVFVADMKTVTDNQGQLLAIVRLIQTRSRGCNAALQFCRGVAQAARLTRGSHLPTEELLRSFASEAGSNQLTIEKDRIKLAMAAHEVVDILVRFEGTP
ncbi:hypothetical protein CA13_67380 [Planctomycetes bacterium CA13]|uniref:Uncharacterized protein n=1 Tax=Novipirellula herctigrandis TaxID=2527986 RepID=A0A5C5YMZ4_9BACT|nr:hypothetical protein CA13_67380 [Planctomycetes bacterium CA13]